MKYKYEPRVKRKYVGSYLPKIDAKEKVMGRTKFFDDITIKARVPRLLYCAILAAPYANGRIISMDTSKAEAMKGVRAIVRYDDPEIMAMPPTTNSWTDTAITPYHRETVPKWFDRKVLDDCSRFVGDLIGVAVAADTREIAEEALKQIDIEWETAPPFLEAEQADEEWATILHPEANPDGNQLPHRDDLDGGSCVDNIVVDKGNVDIGFEEADAVIEMDETFGGASTQGTLDFRGCMSEWVDDRIEVWTNHYYSDQVRMHLHCMLGLPLARIRVHNTNCGAHMGKWNMGEQNFFLLSAILSRRTGCPVKYKMNVHEEFAETRTKINFKIKMGGKKDGTVTAIEFDGIGNNGAYNGVTGYALTGFMNAEGIPRLFFPVENVRMRSRNYFTNRIPGGVFRSIGNVQQNFPLGQAVDKLAEELGIDPIDIYKKSFGNSYDPQPNASICAVLDTAAKEFGWERRHKTGEGELIGGCKKRGMGMTLHNQWHAEWQENERGRIETTIRVNPDLSVILNAPTKETGAGGNSAAVMACADNLSFLGTTPDDIKWVSDGDTEMGLRDCPPTDSVVSFLLSECIVGAAQDVRRQFIERASEMMNISEELLDIKDGKVYKKTEPDVCIDARDIMMEDDCVPITGRNVRNNNKTVTGIAYGAWFAKVEVDTETGEINVCDLLIANDVGQVMHASGAESQQIGGVIMGMGETVSEEIFYDKKTGTPLNVNYIDYKMLTMADAPHVSPLLLEVWKGASEYGACGLAESTPTGASTAIANAVYNAVGIRIHDVPFSPKKVLEGLAEQAMKEAHND